MPKDIKMPCSKYFTYSELIECSDTFKKVSVNNIPRDNKTYDAMEYISREILDKVETEFGGLKLTYGFCGAELAKEIPKNIYPRTDQHAGFETNKNGKRLCERDGFACDFYLENISSLSLARWVIKNCKFDRLYYYGADKPIHVSVSDKPTRQIVLMKFKNIRRVPQKISESKFLNEELDF